jgi:hypothetical protein
MNIKLYEAEDVISKKGGGKKHGARYAGYTKAIGPHLEWLLGQIDASKDGVIRIKLSDFAAACGMKMQKVVDGKVIEGSAGLHPTSAGWGFKYSLFHAGISYNMGKVDDGQPVMIMKRRTDDDVLPASLQEKKTGVDAEADAEADAETTETGPEETEETEETGV